ncbi:hypothetical protein NIES2100_46660 [Calothrix sp. NIES-2100]|uniref:hypothetical protein n=1 Tax=Calothrix sp. NIES-2100 TaxID=1954172 RepID=UPI000B618AF8|nr:hypothetical protein NIES2100_46660 [Calothrix sp. NIES-2100]
MNINLHIEKLILDGLDIPRSQRELLKATVETELGKLLASQELPKNWQPNVSIPTIEVAPKSHPSQMGQQIAQAIYQGMNL